MKKIPRPEDYGFPHTLLKFYCTFYNGKENCHYNDTGIRMLKRRFLDYYSTKFHSLCPKHFQEVIMQQSNEVVQFT